MEHHMKYAALLADKGRKFRLPTSHPHHATIRIDPALWGRFQQLNEEPGVKILGYDEPEDELMTVYVACASKLTKDQLEDGWG
jgi:hypothetical protein